MIGTVVFIGLIATIVTLCICCLTSTCPCYYRRSYTTSTVIVTGHQATPQVVTDTTTNTNTSGPPAPTNYSATGYQPYPLAATVKY